jgi:curved DNA-binding protein CbpA
VSTHYEVLGVPAGASPEEVRQAYLRRARALHPDRLSDVTPVDAARSARAMQDVTEAWRVLRNPASRSAYDQAMAGPPRTASPTTAADAAALDVDDRWSPGGADPGDVATRVVRGLPWVAVVAVLGAIFVFTAFAGRGGDDESPSRWVGRCVGTRTGQGTVEVPCDDPDAERVDLVVERQSQCPQGATATPVDESWLCLRPVDQGR